MLNALRALVVLAALAAFAVAPEAHAAGTRAPASRNLLPNPGFEKTMSGNEWMPAAWDTSDAGVPTVFFGRDSFFVHSGRWAVNIANTSTLFPMSHNWSQVVLIGPESWGKTAVFSVWTKSNGLEGRAYVMAQAYRDSITRMSRIWGVDREEARRRLGINQVNDPLLDLGWQRTSFDDANSEWVRREARAYLAPGTNVLFVRCGMMGTGQVAYDDASLTFEPTPPIAAAPRDRNLLRDPGFEDGGLAWSVSIPPYEGARMDVDTTVAHGGRASMRLSNFSDGLVKTRMGVAQPFLGRSLAGQRVRMSAWAKGDSLAANTYVKVFASTRSLKVVDSPGTEMLGGTFDWSPISVEFDVPSDAELVWAWCITSAPGVGTVWFDDLRFEALGPARRTTAKR